MNEQERQFIDRAKKVLDESVKHLDSESLAGLARARAHALDRSRKNIKWLVWSATSVAGLAAAAALIVHWSAPMLGIEKNFVHDLALLTSEQSIEFYEEIDFYLWLSEVGDEDPDFSDVPDLPPARYSHLRRAADHTGRGFAGRGTAGVYRFL